MWPARPRFRASTATRRSSSTICWRPRRISAHASLPPAIMSPRARCPTARAPSPPGAARGPASAYFLFPPTRGQLAAARFPLGEMTKAETRALARRFDLPVAEKHDSQDICFVPSGRYTDVIERLRPGAAAPGDIVDLDGRVLGRHDGIIHFTVGQRRGLGIAAGVH